MQPIFLTVWTLTLAAGPAAPLPTIAIDLAALDQPTLERLEAAGIYQALVLRLVSENVALVDPRVGADYTLRFESGEQPGRLRISAKGPATSRSQVFDARNLEHEATRLELIHAAIELVRQVQVITPRQPQPQPPDVVPAGLRLSTRVELMAGALWNAGDPGLVTRLSGIQRAGPIDVGVSAILHRPTPMPSTFALTEWGVFAVVGMPERAVGSRARVSAALDAGFGQKRFSYSGPDGNDSGSRLDPALLLHGAITYRLSASWRFGVAAGMFVSHGRVHEDSTGRLFHTPWLRPLAGLTLAFGREVGD